MVADFYIQIRITLPVIVNAIHANPIIDDLSFSTFQLSPLEKYPKHAIMSRFETVIVYLITANSVFIE